MRVHRALRMIALALVALLLLSCTGCWDRRELGQLNVATMLGVDRVVKNGKPGVLLSVLTLKLTAVGGPSGLGGGAAAGGGVTPLGFVGSAEGETINDACRNFHLRSPRILYLGHVQVIVIGEEMARDGIQDVIDFGDRSKDIRYRTDVVTCQGSALEALEAQPEFELLTSTETSRIITNSSSRVSKTVPANLFNVVYGLMTPGRDVAMPRLHLLLPPERGSSVRKGPPSGSTTEDQPGQPSKAGSEAPGYPLGGAQSTPAHRAGAPDQNFNQALGVEEAKHPERKTATMDGSAVFQGDKLVGWLNEEESMGAMFITKQARTGEIPFAFGSSEPNASYVFRHLSVGVKPVITKDGITFQVSIKGSGELSEDKNAAVDTTKQSDIKAAERRIDEEAQHYCQEAVAKCQSLKSDVFGFGDLIHKTDPAAWKQIRDQWRDYFPSVKVQVTAKFSIEQTGVTGEAVKIK